VNLVAAGVWLPDPGSPRLGLGFAPRSQRVQLAPDFHRLPALGDGP
jgi:hypothetical protein